MKSIRLVLQLAGCSLLIAGSALAQGPSYDCGAARGIIETLICQEPALAVLDRRMSEVYAAAERRASDEFPSVL